MKEFSKRYKEFKKYDKNYKKIFVEILDITEKFKVETEGALIDLFIKDKKKEKKEGEEKEDDSMTSEISLVLDRNDFKSLNYKFAKEITLLQVSVPIPPFLMLFPPAPIIQMRI